VQREGDMDEDNAGADLFVTAMLVVSLVVAAVFIANLIGAIHVYG
jgi:hypothetical protein